jgi:hypothetical protein
MISAIFHSTPRLSSGKSSGKEKTQSWRIVTDVVMSGTPNGARERMHTLEFFYFVIPEWYEFVSGIPHIFREKSLDRKRFIC